MPTHVKMNAKFIYEFIKLCYRGQIDSLSRLLSEYQPVKPSDEFSIASGKFIDNPLVCATLGKSSEMVRFIYEELHADSIFTAQVKKTCLIIAMLHGSIDICNYLISRGPPLAPSDYYDDFFTFNQYVHQSENQISMDQFLFEDFTIFGNFQNRFRESFQRSLFSNFALFHRHLDVGLSTSKKSPQMLDWLLSIAPQGVHIHELVSSKVGSLALKLFFDHGSNELIAKWVQFGANIAESIALFGDYNIAVSKVIKSVVGIGNMTQLLATFDLLGLDTDQKRVSSLGISPLSLLIDANRLDFAIYFKSLGAQFENDNQLSHPNSSFSCFADYNLNVEFLDWILTSYPHYIPILQRPIVRLNISTDIFTLAIKHSNFDLIQLLLKYHLKFPHEGLKHITPNLFFPYWDTSSGYLNPLPTQSDKAVLQTLNWLLKNYPSITEPHFRQDSRDFYPLLQTALQSCSIGAVYTILRHTDRIGEPVMNGVKKRKPCGKTPLMTIASLDKCSLLNNNDEVGGQIVQMMCDKAIDLIRKCNNWDEFDEIVGSPVIEIPTKALKKTKYDQISQNVAVARASEGTTNKEQTVINEQDDVDQVPASNSGRQRSRRYKQ